MKAIRLFSRASDPSPAVAVWLRQESWPHLPGAALWGLVCGLGLFAAGDVPGAPAPPARPNIVFFLADDLGYMDIGANNPKTFYETPHIDGLAKKGMRFTSGYVGGAVCSPTRASIMTGRYQQRFGNESNPSPPSNRGLPTNEETFASLLKTAGYVTGAVGKWHLGELTHFHPNSRGFDHFYWLPRRRAFLLTGTGEDTCATMVFR